MSHKAITEPFLMVPYKLLRIPEYGRFFDGAAVGALYRLLRTGVWRQGIEELKARKNTFVNEKGWVTQLAKHYSNGNLSSYFTMSQLEEYTAYTSRHINSLLTKLEDLKLIKREFFSDGFIFILGKRLTLRDSDGYSVGAEHEGFYIDEWESWVDKDEVGFRRFIIEALASPKQRELALGKIFPKVEKNISDETGPETESFLPLGLDNSDAPEAPIIDKVRIDIRKDSDPAPLTLEESSSPGVEDGTDSELSEAIARIRSYPAWEDKVKSARLAVKHGMLISEVNALLSQYLPVHLLDKFSSIPRTGYAMMNVKTSKASDAAKLAKIWAALHEDMTGVVATDTKSFYKEVQGAYKNSLLSQYSFHQCLWTISQVVQKQRELEFLSKGGRNLFKLVEQHAFDYQAVRKEMAYQERRSAIPKPKEISDALPNKALDDLPSYKGLEGWIKQKYGGKPID